MPSFEFDNRKLFTFTLIAVKRDGGSVKLNPLVQSVTWSGDLWQAGMKLEVTLSQYPDLKQMVSYGDRLLFYVFHSETGETIELFSGYIIERGIQSGVNGNVRLTAHDMTFYLLKNKDDFVFRNMSASTIIKNICEQFDIPYYSIADTRHTIKSLVCRNHSLYDTILKALIVTRNSTGEKFILRADGNGVNLYKKKDQPSRWVIENGKNLRSADLTESISEMKNQIKVIGHAQDKEKSKVLATSKDAGNIKKYGLLQELQTADEDGKDKNSASYIANNLLKKLNKVDRKARISAVALHGLYPGETVKVIDRDTGLSGYYYVSSISTTMTGSDATMDLELAWDDDYPDIDVDDQEQ